VSQKLDAKMQIQSATIYVVPTGYRRAVILKLETDTGVCGLGEAGIAYGVGTTATASMLKEMLERFVVGRDPGPIELIWSEIYDVGFWTKGGGAICTAALSAIEHALWDIKGKHLGAPVYELLGGPFETKLAVYANGWWAGCDTPEEFAKAGKAMIKRGYRGLKLYPLGLPDPITVIRHPSRRTVDGETLQLAVDRVKRLRDAVGPDIEIMLDLGGGLADDLLLGLMDRLKPCNPAFVEEPTDPWCHTDICKRGGFAPIPIAAGERAFTRYGFHSLMASGVGILQPDVCNTGGIMEAKKIAAMGEIHNLRVAPHNYGSELATAISVQLSACISNFMVLEVFPDFEKEPGYLQVLETPLESMLDQGQIPVPRAPGLGVNPHQKNLLQFEWATLP